MTTSAAPRLPRTAVAAVLAASAVVALAATWRSVSGDPLADATLRLAALPWTTVLLAALVPLSAVLHFLFAGTAVRAASAVRLPLRRTVGAQLAAAAANRLVPNGVGGIGVNTRYLRRNGLSTGGALAALGSLSVVGGLTDAAYAAAVCVVGPVLGLGGARHELALLTAHGLHATRQVPWALVAAVTAAAGVLLVRHRFRWLRALPRHVGAAARQVGALCRHPWQLLVMAAASMATTAVLSAGFAATVEVVGRGRPLPPAGALLTVYLVAAALGGAAPVPAVAGTTEVALVGALGLGGVPVVTAVVAVILFRALTFWAPVPLGLVAARRLRTQQQL